MSDKPPQVTMHHDQPMQLPDVGDLLYFQLEDGTRIPCIVTTSDQDGDVWRLNAIPDTAVTDDQPHSDAGR